MDRVVLPDGMLHFTRLSFRITTRMFSHMGKKVIRKQFDGRDLGIDSQINQMFIDQGLHLGACIGNIQGVILVSLLHHSEKIPKTTSRTAIGVASLVRKNEVQAVQELFE